MAAIESSVSSILDVVGEDYAPMAGWARGIGAVLLDLSVDNISPRLVSPEPSTPEPADVDSFGGL